MKELDSFTVERLEEFIRQPLENGLTRSEQMELARIALAAKRAESFAWKWRGAVGDIWTQEKRKADFVKENCPELPVTELYTTPQLNSTEIPDGWIKCSDQMPEDCQTVLCNNMLTELSGIPFIADYVGMFDLHDGTRYEAGFYVNRTPQIVTHWMTLPAAPESE